jgi:hypothetical protein
MKNGQFAHHGIRNSGEIMSLPGHRGLNQFIEGDDDHDEH